MYKNSNTKNTRHTGTACHPTFAKS